MARPIGEWFQALRDAGVKAATLLGKGPSLDHYSPVEGAYVMGVNDVPMCQRCDVVVYVDRVLERYAYAGLDIIRPTDWRDAHDGRGYVFEKWRPDNPDNPAALPRSIGGGTGTQALGILALSGVKHVTLWGFDGGVSVLGSIDNAKCLEGKCINPVPCQYSARYGAAMLDVCCQPWSSITLLEHGTPDGMMTLWEQPCQSADTSSTCAA